MALGDIPAGVLHLRNNAQWFIDNAGEILGNGQKAYLSDNSGDHKIGDGSTVLGSLPWIKGGNTALSEANAYTDIAANNAQSNAESYADSLVVGLWDDRGNYDASVNTFPATGGSGSSGAIKKGDIWTVSVGGTLGGNVVGAGDTIRALTDAPGQTASNWALAENNIGYIPESTSNKDTDSTFAANSDTKYPSQKAVKTAMDKKLTGVSVGFISTMNPADNTTYYFGILKSLSGITSDGTDGRVLCAPITGFIIGFDFVFGVGITFSNEANTFIVANKTKSTTANMTTSLQLTGQAVVSLRGFSLACDVGDIIGIRWVTPNWATNPTNVTITGTLLFLT